jgi:glycosyltransferase involved in cell wall biosynthesis
MNTQQQNGTNKTVIHTPLISVVVPMYNVEKTINECLDSILTQTFTEFEIICIDDGCTDGSVKLVEAYTDNRIKLVRQINKGLAAARNTGINASHGSFVAFLDSDDFWHAEKLQQHFDHLCNDPEIGVSYSASAFVDDDSVSMGIGQNPKTNNITSEHILCRNPIGNGSAPVIRRIALAQIAFQQEVNGEIRTAYFDETFRQSEDIECWLRMALTTSWKFEGIKQALSYYRVNSGGLSANLSKQYESWERAIQNNLPGNIAFFQQWLPLATAYQKRYLARRATQSGNACDALKLITEAIKLDYRILTQEPVKTSITLGCALLCALPGNIYKKMERAAMNYAGRRGIA